MKVVMRKATSAVAEGLLGRDWNGEGYVPFGDHPWDYAIYDMNHDGIPELHVRPVPGRYRIYTYDRNKKFGFSARPTDWVHLFSASHTQNQPARFQYHNCA
jgi:hypothetical protein